LLKRETRAPGELRQPALVSVVIPAHNAVSVLSEQLTAVGKAVAAYGRPVEVLVVDNRSTDGTAALAASAGFAVVAATDAAGPGYARNAGAKAARGDLLAFCDADDVVEPGWLSGLVEAASAGADAVAGGIDHETLNDPGLRSWRAPLQSDSLPVLGEYLPYAMTANCAMWADVFEALGGFDEWFGRSSEDVDFFWRLQLAGFRLAFAADAVVQYRHRSDLRHLVKQHYQYGRSEAYCYRKYRSAGMPRRRLRRAAKDWRDMLRRGPSMWADPIDRGVWLRLVAYRLGYVSGSFRARVVYV
jgi:GT2 family glycosyltransferase